MYLVVPLVFLRLVLLMVLSFLSWSHSSVGCCGHVSVMFAHRFHRLLPHKRSLLFLCTFLRPNYRLRADVGCSGSASAFFLDHLGSAFPAVCRAWRSCPCFHYNSQRGTRFGSANKPVSICWVRGYSSNLHIRARRFRRLRVLVFLVSHSV